MLRYVFIASTAYSGSTLLSALLGLHPEIATVSDVSGTRRRSSLATYRCSCGERMLEDPFWGAVREAARSHGIPDLELSDFRLGFDYAGGAVRRRFLTGSLGRRSLEQARDAVVRRWPLHERHMRAIGERNRHFAEAVLAVTARRVFVDASKERLRARHLRRYLGGDLRIVHLVRDSRGVVDSTIRRGKEPGADIRELARNWARTHESILRDLADFPADRRMLVRYEDLAGDHRAVLREMYRFCGVDPAVTPRLPGPDEAPALHLLGNRMRLEQIGRIRPDERWRDSLTDADLETIAAAAGTTHARFYRPIR